MDGSLMGRCRRSLARFVPKEALEDVLYFVMETVSESTPQDETRADFVQGIHASGEEAAVFSEECVDCLLLLKSEESLIWG